MPRQEWGGIEPMGKIFLLTFLFIGLADISGLILTRKYSHKHNLLGWWNGRVIAFEACIGHSALRLGVLHEGLPDEGGACVFCHEHGDAGVDADDVSVIPLFQWIEGIDKAVAAPGLRVTTSDVLQDTHGGLRQKRQ